MFHTLLATAPPLVAQAAPPAGEQLRSVVDHSWPLPIWATLLLFAAAAVYVAALYLLEREPRRPWIRLTLAALRTAVIAVILVMMHGHFRQLQRVDLPDLVIALDVSGSMAHRDELERQSRERVLRRLKSADLSEPSRLALAKSLVLAEDRKLLERLAKDYRLKIYLTGSRARRLELDQKAQQLHALRARDSASQLGDDLIAILEDQQRGRPPAAIIVMTDGAVTSGRKLSQAARAAREANVPLHIVAVGLDRPAKDIALSDLVADTRVYQGDVASFRFTLTATGMAGKQVELRLRRDGDSKVLARRQIDIESEAATIRPQLRWRAQGPLGKTKYVVEAAPLPGEIDPTNNTVHDWVEIHDDPLRVLLVQAKPSYEYRFLKQLLGRSTRGQEESQRRAIELTTVLQEADPLYPRIDPDTRRDFPFSRSELFKYHVVIFGDVRPGPAALSESDLNNLRDFVVEHGGGLIVFAGPEYTPLAYRGTPLAELLPIDVTAAVAPKEGDDLDRPFRVVLSELGAETPHLQLGSPTGEAAKTWAELPELYWLLRCYRLKPAARVLAQHPTLSGEDGAPLPVISLQFVGAGKVVFHATDGTHRWRQGVGDKYFGQYWLQTIQYLSRKQQDGSAQAIFTTDRQSYETGDPITLRLRYLSEQSAPPAETIGAVLERSGGARRNVLLRRRPTQRGVFEAVLRELPAGGYEAVVELPKAAALDESPAGLNGASGPAAADPERPTGPVRLSQRFTVRRPPNEQSRIALEAADLSKAQREHGARLYTFGRTDDPVWQAATEVLPVDQLADKLPAGGATVVDRDLPSRPIWNHWPWALVVIVLLAAEWTLRKRVGLV